MAEQRLLIPRERVSVDVGTVPIFVQTKHAFEVYVHQKRVNFQQPGAKELLALLIDRRGEVVSAKEVFDVIRRSKGYKRYTRAYFSHTLLMLYHALEKENIGNILVMEAAGCRINPVLFECDYYAYLVGKSRENFVREEYMPEYVWSRDHFCLR